MKLQQVRVKQFFEHGYFFELAKLRRSEIGFKQPLLNPLRI
jgi:hypothetical protein